MQAAPTKWQQGRAVLFLAIGWGAAVGALFITVSSGTAAAAALQGRRLATLPVGLLVVAATLTALSLQQLIARLGLGRRGIFAAAAAAGAVGAALFAVACHVESFALMLVAAVPQGVAYGAANQFRFVAVEATLPEHKERALAAVVGGAVLAAFIGPEASRHIRFRMDTDYLAAFLLACGLFLVQMVCTLLVDFALPGRVSAAVAARTAEQDVEGQSAQRVSSGEPDEWICNQAAPGIGEPKAVKATPPATARPWHVLLRQPRFALSAYIAAAAFFGMAGLMAATPLAMADAGYDVDDSTLVIEGHLVAMYLPSLVSGVMLKRLRAPTMLLLGAALYMLGNGLFFVSASRPVFWLALILIGVGWNFDYVTASAAALQTLAPAERLVGQGVFDAVALSGLSVAMVSSSFTFDGVGWATMYRVYLGINATIVLAAIGFAAVAWRDGRRS